MHLYQATQRQALVVQVRLTDHRADQTQAFFCDPARPQKLFAVLSLVKHAYSQFSVTELEASCLHLKPKNCKTMRSLSETSGTTLYVQNNGRK